MNCECCSRKTAKLIFVPTYHHLADDNVETEMLPEHVKVISLPPEVMGGITSAEGLVSPPTVETVDVFAMCQHLVCVCVCVCVSKK